MSTRYEFWSQVRCGTVWWQSESHGYLTDGTERQNIKDVDGSTPRPRIRSCCVADPFIMVIREDDSLGLFVGETEKGKIRRKDMSPMGHKVCAVPI